MSKDISGHVEKQGLVEASGDIPGVGTYAWHIAEDRLEWSPGLARIYGLETPPAEELGFLSMIHPDDRVRVEAETSSILGSGGEYQHEFRIVRPDGTIRVVHDRGAILRNQNGEAVVLKGMNVDVTAQRAPAWDDAERSEDLETFRRLADNIDQLAWIADETGSIYWYNKRWFEFTGATLDGMRGWGWTRVHHPDHVDRVVERIRHSFETGLPWEDTFPLRGRDGAYRWFLSRAQPIRDGNGAVRRWYGTNTDVTDALAAREELKRSEERFRRTADAMPHLVWNAGSDGRVTYYNRQIRNFAPICDQETGAFDWTLLVHPEDLARTLETWHAAAADGREFSCEHRLCMADGDYRWHLSLAAPVQEEGRRDFVWYGTATDIHTMKELEAYKTLLSDELEHRMKNTLAMVQSMANQTFRRVGGDRRAVEAFSDRLRALAGAHDILFRENWTQVGLDEVCESTLAPLGLVDRVARDGADLVCAPRVGVVLALGLHELATNAMKYGALSRPEGRVALAWRPDASRPGGFRMDWRETGGPAVSPPETEGFGSRLLKTALAAEIEGSVVLHFEPGGLVCTVEGSLR